jgi:DNA mismatch repair protein MutS2
VQVTAVAGTPSSLPPVADIATLEDLEFFKVLDEVADRAVSAAGAMAVRARRPGTDVATVRRELAEIDEYRSALEHLANAGPQAVPDLAGTLDMLETEGVVLDPEVLALVGQAIAGMRANADTLGRLGDHAPAVAAWRVDVPSVDLERALVRAIGPDGEVTDDASPAVAKARRTMRDLRARLVRRLETFARDLPHEFRVQDGSVTVRDGRMVVPVRREARGRITGLVHGESTSGATVFLEPSDAVDAGNEWRAAIEAERRAVLQLLRELTRRVVDESAALADGWAMSVRFDDLYARARYAAEHGTAAPHIGEPSDGLVARNARHPLVGGASLAVPFDVDLTEGRRTLMVSGPNAGGKTVLLKAVGLLHAMTQSGLAPLVGAGSRLPIVRRIHTDIGDHQSIEASLSTFSAHLAAIQRIVAEADADALVLLDEIGSGTDPMEGAAIAGAVLTHLNAHVGMTVATTHLNQLKELASSTDGMVNASLAFDTETLSPTFRLVVGTPGRSYGIAIARRLGLDPDVVAEAERLLPEAVRSFEAALADLERREADLLRREDATASERLRQDAEALKLAEAREAVETREAAVGEAERELERSGREQARKFLLESRKRVEEALGVARAAVTEATAREARRLVEDGVRAEADALRRLEEEARKKGWRVSGRASAAAELQPERTSPPARSGPTADGVATRTAAIEIDLRGMRVDEAEAALLAALDDAVMDELPALRVIHGKGTGALRVAVQSMLERDRRVASFAFAAAQQGGTGVTMVEFAR